MQEGKINSDFCWLMFTKIMIDFPIQQTGIKVPTKINKEMSSKDVIDSLPNRTSYIPAND